MAQHEQGERSGASCLPSESSRAKVHASRWSLRYDIVLRIPLHFIALHTVAVIVPGECGGVRSNAPFVHENHTPTAQLTFNPWTHGHGVEKEKATRS